MPTLTTICFIVLIFFFFAAPIDAVRYASFLIPLAVYLMQKTTPFILFVISGFWEVPKSLYSCYPFEMR